MKIFKMAHLCTMLAMGIGCIAPISADNQTPTVSEVHPDHNLPYRIKLRVADFELPTGLQSYIHAIYHDKWLFITGRLDGLHGFVNNSTTNFPIDKQNTYLFVVDPIKRKSYYRSLLDPGSGLTQQQIELLSVTAAQGYQKGKTLYITGGYGYNSSTGSLDTKNALTAINVPGLIHWVTDPDSGETAAEHIRQIFDDTFKVTGGYMNQVSNGPTLLIMGQEFDGFYMDPSQSPPVFQQYTEQVRRFRIIDDGINLSFIPEAALPPVPNPDYRRRDLNVVPVIKRVHNTLEKSFVVLSGVFTLTTGIWTVPVEVSADGFSTEADPTLDTTFKQGMNSYDCATFGMYSRKTDDMYNILLGGMSYGFFSESGSRSGSDFIFETDDEIPFINQTTTVRIDKRGHYSQYFMEHGSFPYLTSKTVNPGNQLLFGSECEVLLLDRIVKYSNGVVDFDSIKKPTLVGYVVGGIASTLPNTNTQADSFPTRHIFEIIVEPIGHSSESH